ncbi:uncharacterized protein LOC108666536 [Hyalella azteca]|uniref:Uncharacterized protein LOC108666536 n=1 Tax=Hyalella azteca TaxID=294128 RepID=A0A8B7N5Q1_HYAAZ|nr:uncharacterized protein LOC108666536 [Hyalella azteca]
MNAPALLLALLVAAASPASATDQTSHAEMPRASESSETFVLQTNLQTNLFSTCAAEANSVSGSLYSIELGTSEFVELTSSSTQNITWVVKSGVKSTIDCAQATLDAGKLMFKYSGGTCKVAAKGIYDPSQPSCTGETVYVLSNTTTACFTSLGAFLDGERITTDGNCTSTCAAGSVVSGGGTVLTNLQEETLHCCNNTKSPCVHFCGCGPACGNVFRKEYFCDAVAVCAYHGLLLAEVDTQAKLNDILDIISQQDPNVEQFWVNIRRINGSWVHVPSNKPVAASDWGRTPVDTECAYMDKYNEGGLPLLKTAPCDGNKRAFPCVDPTKSLPVC